MKHEKNHCLTNKNIIITGANSGIGLAAAQKVIAAGANAILVCRDAARAEQVCAKLGKQAFAYICDVSHVTDISNAYHQIAANFEVIHGVVANAGNAILESIPSITEESFDVSVNTNLKGSFFTAQKALPLMKSGGSIIFISSLAAHRSFTNASIYSATKAGLVSLAASMALELGEYGIRVNSISPGTVITPLFNKLGMAEQEVSDFIASYKQKISLCRTGCPEEIADVVVFLLSSSSSFITGTDILVDGGLANCVK